MIELKSQQFWRATIALGLAAFIAFANLYFTQPILPIISEQFSVSPLTASLTVSLSLLTVAIFFFFYSAVSDARGRKKILVISIVLLLFVTFAVAFVQSFAVFLLLRILQGIFIAGIPTVALAYIGEEFSPRALTVAIGIYISMNTVGGMGGRVISGLFTDLLDWRVAFIAISIISCIFFILFLKLLPPSHHFHSKKFDRKTAIRNYLAHLKNRKLRLAFFIGGLHFFIFVGVYNYVTYLLTDAPFSLPTVFIGFLFLTYLSGTVSSTLAGKAIGIWSQGTTIAIGVCIMVTATLLMLIANLFAIIGSLFLLSFGFFFVHSTLNAWVSKRATFAKASASGLYFTSYYVGGSLGSFYLGLFWHFWHWPGVIVGTLLILALTTNLVIQMIFIERSENVTKQQKYELVKVT